MAVLAEDLRTIDLQLFAATPLVEQPFPHLIVPRFIRAGMLDAIDADYPKIDKPGSFPVSEAAGGPAFDRFLDDLNSPRMTEAFARKFGLDLADHPIMITVRGRTQAKDGRIHTDSRTKLITVLIYMNAAWEEQGGRLRLLRSPDTLEDCFAEVPPIAGTMLAFLNTDNAWHGHKPHVGERRTIQLNWVRDQSVVAREQARHRLSARLKRLNPFA